MASKKNERYFYVAFTGFIDGKPALTSQFTSNDGSMLSFEQCVKTIKEFTGHDGHWIVSFIFEFKDQDDYNSAQK